MAQTVDLHHANQKAQQIREQVSTILMKWGLLPRFKRWRLTQDPETGMVVLFGILNNSYIATHTIIPFSDYFDPRVLHDLADELQVQVVSCNTDGLRYAFILDRGRFEKLPTHVDYPYMDNGKLLVRVVYGDPPPPVPTVPTPPVDIELAEDPTFVRRIAGAFMKVFDDIKLKDDAALLFSAQNPPDVVVINEDEFHKRVAEHEANRQKVKRINKSLDKAAK